MIVPYSPQYNDIKDSLSYLMCIYILSALLTKIFLPTFLIHDFLLRFLFVKKCSRTQPSSYYNKISNILSSLSFQAHLQTSHFLAMRLSLLPDKKPNLLRIQHSARLNHTKMPPSIILLLEVWPIRTYNLK